MELLTARRVPREPNGGCTCPKYQSCMFGQEVAIQPSKLDKTELEKYVMRCDETFSYNLFGGLDIWLYICNADYVG